MIHPFEQVEHHSSVPFVVGHTRADKRPLSETDRFYFLYGISHIASIFAFQSTLLRSDAELPVVAACQRVLETTPLLQTQIVGDADCWPYFSQMTNPNDWPQLEIVHAHNNEKAFETAHSLVNETIAYFDASLENRRKAGRFIVIRGKSTTVFCFAALHAFTDGAGVSSLVNKFLLYALIPRLLWRFIDRRSTSRWVPTISEMALKNQWALETINAVDYRNSERFDPCNFSFADFTSPLCGLDGCTVGRVSSARKLRKVRLALRKLGISLTYAFAAVAMKTLAVIIAENIPGYKDTGDSLVFMIPVDPRPFGQWGDERDKGCSQFPVVANLSFLTFASVTCQDLQENSIQQIASLLKEKVSRLYTDPVFLVQEIQATSARDQLGYFCGCSSFRIPNRAAWLGVAPTHFETMRYKFHYSRRGQLL